MWIDYVWGGMFGIMFNCMLYFVWLLDIVILLLGFLGYGVVMVILSGKVVVDVILGQVEKFDVIFVLFSLFFSGGIMLCWFLLVMVMVYYLFRDWL